MAKQPARTEILYHEDGPEFIIVDETCHRSADGRAVVEDDKDGRWFYCRPGTRLSLAEAQAVGIVKPKARPANKPNRASKPGGTK